MDEDRVIGDQTVVVDGGKIISIEDSARARVPDGVTRIDASGHYLIPDEHRRVIERNFKEFHRPLTLALHRAGGKMMTGTDALIPSNVPGFGIHDELAELVDVGLPPYEALRASTTLPHEFLGELDMGGTVEVGKRADLVLLEANPLDDIANTRAIKGVVIGGRWLSEDDFRLGLDGLLESNK